jgi:hypothetical protein
MAAGNSLPEERLREIHRRLLDVARSLECTDRDLLFECVYALHNFDGHEVRDFFHHLFDQAATGRPDDSDSMLQWALIGLCAVSGDTESCRLLLRLIGEGRLAPGLVTEFRERGGPMLQRALNLGGADSDVLRLCCELAAQDTTPGHAVRQLLEEAVGSSDEPHARETVRSWLQSNHPAVCAFASGFLGEDEQLPAGERRLMELLRAVANGKEHTSTLSEYTGKIGRISLPVLKRCLAENRDGPLGQAAIIAAHGLPPNLALGLADTALQSEWAAVRHYAAEYLLLPKVSPMSSQARELAKQRLSAETDSGVRSLLEEAAR